MSYFSKKFKNNKNELHLYASGNVLEESKNINIFCKNTNVIRKYWLLYETVSRTMNACKNKI